MTATTRPIRLVPGGGGQDIAGHTMSRGLASTTAVKSSSAASAPVTVTFCSTTEARQTLDSPRRGPHAEGYAVCEGRSWRRWTRPPVRRIALM